MIRSAIVTLALICGATSVASQDLVLQAPIDCSLGDDCYIQQYVDHIKGKGVGDFRCASLSYQGHKGTDFALRTLNQMRVGVDVLAAAPGVVRGARNGVKDEIYSAENAESVKGRECGNGVVIRHGGGWETQYCHLKNGSLQVKKGQKVEAGTVLGQIGLSGRTQFPHVHLSVRKNGKVVDPFDPDGNIVCGTPEKDVLWAKPLPYRPGGILYAGFSDRVPEFTDVKSGRAAVTSLPADAPAIVIFGLGFGAQKGDDMRLVLKGPSGVMLDETIAVKKNQAQLFKAVGKRLKKRNWPSGRYSGSVSLVRDGKVINSKQAKIIIE